MLLITRFVFLVLFTLLLAACASTPPGNNDDAMLLVPSDSEREEARRTHRLALDALQAKVANAWRKRAVANDMARAGVDLFTQGYYLDAIDYFNAAVDVQEQTGDDNGRVYNLNNLARLYTLVGNQQAARRVLDQALHMAEQLNSSALQASSYINLGNLKLNLRDYQGADASLQRAIVLSESAQRDDLHAEAFIVQGAVYRQQSDFEQALVYYQQALKLYKRLRRKNETAMSLRVLGELFLHRVEGSREKNLAEAESLLTQALEQHQRNNDRLSSAMTLSHLGEHAYEIKDYPRAIERYRKAQTFFETSGFPDGTGRMYIHLGFAYGKNGELQQALASFASAIDIYGDLKDREWQRVALFGKGIYLQQQGNKTAAEQSFKQAVELFESIRADVVGGETAETLFTQVNRELYERLIELLLDRGDVEGALEYVERSRLRALRDNLLNTRVTGKTRGGNDIVELKELSTERAFVRNQLLTAQDVAVRNTLSDTLARNELEANKVVYRLNARYRGIEHTLDVVPNTRSFRHSDIFPDDLAIITYFATAESLYIFVVKKGSEVMVEKVSVSGKELADRVANTLRMIVRGKDKHFTMSADDPLVQALVALSRILIAPIKPHLANINTLALLPVKWLNYLPFEVLIVETEKGNLQFLQEARQVMYLSSQTYANQIFTLRTAKAEAESPDIIAFGNPDLGNPDLALPFAAEEVKEIGRLFPDSVIFIDDQATKTNFFTHWGKHRIVHVAAHARLQAGQARILFAPDESGTIVMDELFDLAPNEKTEFVVLSACESALDPGLTAITWQPRGDDQDTILSASGPVTSAAHTLLLVGIPAVTASLWKVDDQATAVLMSEFYRQLKDKYDVYRAFRQAQLKMMKRQDAYSHPYYWAGFVFYGLLP